MGKDTGKSNKEQKDPLLNTARTLTDTAKGWVGSNLSKLPHGKELKAASDAAFDQVVKSLDEKIKEKAEREARRDEEGRVATASSEAVDELAQEESQVIEQESEKKKSPYEQLSKEQAQDDLAMLVKW